MGVRCGITRLWWVLMTSLLFCPMASAVTAQALTEPSAKPAVLVRVTTTGSTADGSRPTLEGRILVEARDSGMLLEERNGRVRQLLPAVIQERMTTEIAFTPMSAEELSTDLLAQVPPGFEITQTEHYVICANSAEEYAEFCGKLLERVFDEFFKFMKEQDVAVTKPTGKLPIIIFNSEPEFKDFAAKQHPETSFDNTPGYYSIRENQTLLLDLTRDRSIRSSSAIRKRLADQPLQVATMVHEAVHQLAFNSGLQVRMTDNPLWFSEGLALYFEPISPRSSTLWTKPGTVNSRHHPSFVQFTNSGAPEIPLQDLVGADKSFLDSGTVAAAYAESWGLTTYLFRQEKEGMKKYLSNLSQRKPLQALTPEQRLLEFRQAFGKLPDEMEREVVSYVRRLRVQK